MYARVRQSLLNDRFEALDSPGAIKSDRPFMAHSRHSMLHCTGSGWAGYSGLTQTKRYPGNPGRFIARIAGFHPASSLHRATRKHATACSSPTGPCHSGITIYCRHCALAGCKSSMHPTIILGLTRLNGTKRLRVPFDDGLMI